MSPRQQANRARTLTDARARIVRELRPLGPEHVSLAQAASRVLAQDVIAGEDLWPFSRAAMDGIAVRFLDIAAATPDSPARLTVRGSVYCGDPPGHAEAPRCAVRIATGAPLPAGTDTVIQSELLRWDGEIVVVQRPLAAGSNVFPAAEDARRGETVVSAGTVLSGGHLSLLAALGHGSVPVFKRPRVAILACGDELVPPEGTPGPGRIRESNSYGLLAEIEAIGATPVPLGLVPDDPEALACKLRGSLDADALITIGGLSVGERDFVRLALERAGALFRFEGIPLKPGHPAAFATIGELPVFALPGTPGACRAAFEVLVRPALLRLMGRRETHRPTMRARLTTGVAVRPGRSRALWARLSRRDGAWVATPLGDQGSATMRSAADADALLLIEPHRAWLSAGTQVCAWLLSERPLLEEHRTPMLRLAVGVVGARGAGKTTLIERLIPLLARYEVRVAVVKHHAHADDLDLSGTDTARVAAAGAARTILAGPRGVVARAPAASDPALEEVLAQLEGVDLALVEGYASSALPKILVRRKGIASDRPQPAEPIIACVDDLQSSDLQPCFGWDRLDELAAYLAGRFFPGAG
ncbi:MAG: molybdopterin-guanine dinucleotide biosynthesis protein B [Vulcanimicrobiaceae bacterium]